MTDDCLYFCKNMLNKVSRSFALTIPMLDDVLYRPVMVTYLIDRLLDNFEDEIEGVPLESRKQLMDQLTAVFTPSAREKKDLIRQIEDSAGLIADNSLRILTANTGKIYRVFSTMDREIQEISSHWLQEMNRGMQIFLNKPVKTFADLDQYCYYVAGTVGGFLTDLLLLKGERDREREGNLKNNFVDAGLFLQKVNIIRDIKKDIRKRQKHYWPLQSLKLDEEMLRNREYEKQVLLALNKMITDVRQHLSGLVKYLQALPVEFPGYKRFFTVNNALGLATLLEMKDNPAVVYGSKKVKVSKIKFVRIMKAPEKHFKRLLSME